MTQEQLYLPLCLTSEQYKTLVDALNVRALILKSNIEQMTKQITEIEEQREQFLVELGKTDELVKYVNEIYDGTLVLPIQE